MVLQHYHDGENDSKGSVLIENDGRNSDINRVGGRRAKNPPNVGQIGCACSLKLPVKSFLFFTKIEAKMLFFHA